MNRLLIAIGAAALLGLGGCAQTGISGAPAAPLAQAAQTSEPSPRPECAPVSVTLYFAEQVASDEPVVTPLLNDFVARLRACEAAGGEIRAITIAATADPGQRSGAARAQIARRVERVRAALINAGAPADKIAGAAADHAEPIMGRRAEVTAALW